jgi:hypothetical protein
MFRSVRYLICIKVELPISTAFSQKNKFTAVNMGRYINHLFAIRQLDWRKIKFFDESSFKSKGDQLLPLIVHESCLMKTLTSMGFHLLKSA